VALSDKDDKLEVHAERELDKFDWVKVLEIMNFSVSGFKFTKTYLEFLVFRQDLKDARGLIASLES
jgi:hypothetical protein